MENWKKDSRKDIVMVDVDALVPPDHLLRKVERVMDYDWLYEQVKSILLRRQRASRNGSCSVDQDGSNSAFVWDRVFTSDSPGDTSKYSIPLVLGIQSTGRDPSFRNGKLCLLQTLSPELSEEIFAHILNKALNNRMVDPSMIFIDGTHIKASANKKEVAEGTGRQSREGVRGTTSQRGIRGTKTTG